MMYIEDEFDSLIHQLYGMVHSATGSEKILSFDLRRILRFINKVIQVVEQSFEDVLATIIELKYVTEADRRSGKLEQISKELEQLHSRSRYRDAEEICNRLCYLGQYYNSDIEPITRNLIERNEWRSVFGLLNEHEGKIITLVNDSIEELEELLSQPMEHEIDYIRGVANRHTRQIRDSLSNLRSLNGQILGLSGSTSLLELSEDKNLMSVFAYRGGTKMGDIFEVNQAGAVGPHAYAQETTFYNIGTQIENSVDLLKLAHELAILRQVMLKEATEVEHSIAVGNIAQAEQAAKSKDVTTVAKCLKSAGKWTLDIASKIGVPIAVEALKQAIGMPV